MADNILEMYRQDLDEMYKRYSKLYTICAFSIVGNFMFTIVYLIHIASKLP